MSECGITALYWLLGLLASLIALRIEQENGLNHIWQKQQGLENPTVCFGFDQSLLNVKLRMDVSTFQS